MVARFFDGEVYESDCSSRNREDVKSLKRQRDPIHVQDEFYQPYDAQNPYSKLSCELYLKSGALEIPYQCTAYCSRSNLRCLRRSVMSSRENVNREVTCEAHCPEDIKQWIRKPTFNFRAQLEKYLDFYELKSDGSPPLDADTPYQRIFEALGIDPKLLIEEDSDFPQVPYMTSIHTMIQHISAPDMLGRFAYRIIAQRGHCSLLIATKHKDKTHFLVYDTNPKEYCSSAISVSLIQSMLPNSSDFCVDGYSDGSNVDRENRYCIFLTLLALSKLLEQSCQFSDSGIGVEDLKRVLELTDQNLGETVELTSAYNSFCEHLDSLFLCESDSLSSSASS